MSYSDHERKELPPAAIAALQKGRKIEAIKIVRNDWGIGLKSAKAVVDQYSLKAEPVRRTGGGSTAGQKAEPAGQSGTASTGGRPAEPLRRSERVPAAGAGMDRLVRVVIIVVVVAIGAYLWTKV